MYNRYHTCLVASNFSVLLERLVSVVVRCVVKDQQVGPFCSGFVYVAINFFFKSQRSILVSCGLALSQDATTVLTWVPSRFGQVQSLRKRMESFLEKHRSSLKVRKSSPKSNGPHIVTTSGVRVISVVGSGGMHVAHDVHV